MRVDLIGCRKPEIFTHLLSWEKKKFPNFCFTLESILIRKTKQIKKNG